jgi:DNA end-binding protein Ku
MAARAIWKGSLILGSEKISVKLYSAIEDRTVRFNVLEKSSRTRIKQQMVNPDTGEEVPWDKMQRAFEAEPGTYVLLTNEELEQSQPKETRDINVSKFVPARQIHQQWYDRPYYLGPDDGSPSAYFALAEALERQDREGIAHWVMRQKEYLGALRSEGGYLMLITLNHIEEVLAAEDLPKPAGRAPDSKEFKMAEQLVTAMEGEFHAEDYHDEYRQSVMKFIKAKSHGHKSRLKMVTRRKEPKSLLADLTASIKMARHHHEQKSAA